MQNIHQLILDSLNYYLSIATIIAMIVVFVWIIGLVFIWGKKEKCIVRDFIAKHALFGGFALSLLGTCFTLFYSDYLGVLPCGLCWFQRVFLYSQIFIYGMAWYKSDKKIFDYTLMLSVVGFIIAFYHSYLQMGYSELVPCPVVASTIDCAKPTFIEFGFVTFPFMSVILFSMLMLLSTTAKRFRK